MVFDVYKTVVINGKEYKLGFPNDVLFEAEQRVAGGNLIKLIATPPPSIGDIYILFKYAVLGGGNNLNNTGIDELFNDAIAELGGIVGVGQIVLDVLAKAAPLQKGKETKKE